MSSKHICLENLKKLIFQINHIEEHYFDIIKFNKITYVDANKIYERKLIEYKKEFERCKDIIKPE